MGRRKKQVGGNLDSLLDTMTNVVGILVIVLIVTQLGVRDAVKQISEKNPIDPKLLEQTEAELAKVRTARNDLAATRDALRGTGEVDPRTARQNKVIADHQANIAGLKKTRSTDVKSKEKERDEKNKVLQDQQKEKAEVNKRLTAAEETLEKLRAQLQATPQRKVLAPKVLRLPNPRSAPKDTRPILFICRDGRISFVNTPLIQDKAQKWVAALLRNKDPKAPVDGDLLTKQFNRNPRKLPPFDLYLAIHGGRWPRIVLKRKKSGGETARQIQSENSDYQRGMKKTDPRKYYAQFLVWPNSFETYLEARQIASKHGVLAGWQPQDMKDYTIPLGGSLRVGKPPEPKPKPPPTKTPPKPPPKPPPVDTID